MDGWGFPRVLGWICIRTAHRLCSADSGIWAACVDGGGHLPAAPCHAAPCCADVLRSRCAALQVWKVEEGEPEYAALVFYDEITRGESFLCECLVWLCRNARQACLLASCCHDGQEEEEDGRGGMPRAWSVEVCRQLFFPGSRQALFLQAHLFY